MRKIIATSGLLVLVLLLSSCLKVDGTIKIEDDGSGTVDFLSALDLGAVESAFGDLSVMGGETSICEDFDTEFGIANGLPPGASVQPYDQDGFCGERVTYPLAASLDHSEAIEDLFNGNGRLYKEDDNWFFDVGLDAEGLTSEADAFGTGMAEALFSESSFRITVDLPGSAVDGENNATEVNADGAFVWDIDLLNPPARLFAQTDQSSGGFSPLLIGLIVAGLLGAGALVWFINQRNGDTAASVDAPLPGELAGMPGAAPAGTQMSAGATATIPQTVVPPISSGPPINVMAAPSDPNAIKETVLINPATMTSTQDVPLSEPTYDESIGAWIIDDPARGRLRHDTATDTWNPL